MQQHADRPGRPSTARVLRAAPEIQTDRRLRRPTTVTAVCKLRWVLKKPEDMMVIKNYEAIRLMMSAKMMEEAETMAGGRGKSAAGSRHFGQGT